MKKLIAQELNMTNYTVFNRVNYKVFNITKKFEEIINDHVIRLDNRIFRIFVVSNSHIMKTVLKQFYSSVVFFSKSKI